MTDSLQEGFFAEEPAILENDVKTALKAKKSPGKDGILIVLFQATETEFIKIFTRICQ